MPKCSFCNSQLEAGTGKMYVENNGKIFWFCSTKCEKNLKELGRDPRNFKWTKQKA